MFDTSSDPAPWLDDRKWAFIRLEGRNFGDVPLTVELKLEVHDDEARDSLEQVIAG